MFSVITAPSRFSSVVSPLPSVALRSLHSPRRSPSLLLRCLAVSDDAPQPRTAPDSRLWASFMQAHSAAAASPPPSTRPLPPAPAPSPPPLPHSQKFLFHAQPHCQVSISSSSPLVNSSIPLPQIKSSIALQTNCCLLTLHPLSLSVFAGSGCCEQAWREFLRG